MRKSIFIALLFVSGVAFGQADVYRTRPVTNTGANFNKQGVHDANLTADFTLRIPRSTHFTLNGGKDTLGAIAYALDVHKMGVYRGGGVWDTLNNAGSSITQTQVLHLADSLLSKLNVGDSTKYATQYYVNHGFVPYNGATQNVNLGNRNITGNLATFNNLINIDTATKEIIPLSGGFLYWGGNASLNLLDGSLSSPKIMAGRLQVIEDSGGASIDLISAYNNKKWTINHSEPFENNILSIAYQGNRKLILDTLGNMLLNSGAFSVTAPSITADGMGAINVTMPDNSNNYAYYGMTRSGITAVATGIDNLNAYIIGTGPTRGNGATIDTFLFRLNTHNGNLMLYGTLSVPGTTTLTNYYTTSSTPTFALGGSTIVGTGASMSVTGTNQGGEITLTTGTSVSATGILFTITLNGFAYPIKCFPVLTPEIDASTTRFTVGSLSNNSFTYSSNGTNLSASTTYVFTYNIAGH